MKLILAVLAYLLLAAAGYALNSASATALAFELIAAMILLTAARLTLAAAGSSWFMFLPLAALGGWSAGLLMPQQVLSPPWQPFWLGLVSPVICTLIAVTLMRITKTWRSSAVGGLGLAMGALLLSLALPELQKLKIPANNVWLDQSLGDVQLVITTGMTAAVVALSLSLLIYARLASSAGYLALKVGHEDPHWGGLLGVSLAGLRWQTVAVSAFIAGLAAVPIAASELSLSGNDPTERWLVLWLVAVIIVIIAGRPGLAETLWLGFWVLALPAFLNLWQSELPDLRLVAGLIALMVASFMHKGQRPGDPGARA